MFKRFICSQPSLDNGIVVGVYELSFFCAKAVKTGYQATDNASQYGTR
jgi:hypothetical protein